MNGIDNPTLMLIAGVILLGVTVLRIMRRQGSVPREMDPSRFEVTAPLASKAKQITDDMEVRLYQTFRELNARLETKIHVFNELLVEIEKKTERLEKLLARGESVEAAGEEPVIVGLEESRAAEAGRFDEIHALSDRGMTPSEISQRVDLPIGEINLILSLRRRRKSG